MGAKYCDQRVCMCVCLFARLYQKPHVRQRFTEFSAHVTCGRGGLVARTSFDGNAIRYVLPVLWMPLILCANVCELN